MLASCRGENFQPQYAYSLALTNTGGTQQGSLSSTLREVIGACKLVTVLLEQVPSDLLKTRRILFVEDNFLFEEVVYCF